MCTIGGLSYLDAEGRRRVWLIKNLDFRPESGVSFTPMAHREGYRTFACLTTRQFGFNSGFNEKGLGISISFSDYRTGLGAGGAYDTRTLANEEALRTCACVSEALDFFHDWVERHPDMPGGNHMIADRGGALAVLEHSEGGARHEIYTQAGFAARGNNSLLLIGEKQRASLPAPRVRDIFSRSETMHGFLEGILPELQGGLPRDEFLARVKDTLSAHQGVGEDQFGWLCAHGRGARLAGTAGSWTLASFVFDLTDARAYYMYGNPCRAAGWTEAATPWAAGKAQAAA